MSDAINIVADFDTEKEKVEVIRAIAVRRGRQRITACDYRPRRSDRQLAWYWPCFCEMLAAWITENWGETATKDDAHRVFKETFLQKPVTNRHGEQLFKPNGDPLTVLGSTSDLDTVGFNHYLDKCAGLLRDMCKHTVPPPDIYHWKDPEPRKLRIARAVKALPPAATREQRKVVPA